MSASPPQSPTVSSHLHILFEAVLFSPRPWGGNDNIDNTNNDRRNGCRLQSIYLLCARNLLLVLLCFV